MDGLDSLTELKLWNNKIKHIEPNSLPNKNIQTLKLDNNKLSVLLWTIFGEEHPTHLTLDLSRNPLACKNMSLCWIRLGVQDGWINLNSNTDCGDTNTYWNAVTLDCSHLGLLCFNCLCPSKPGAMLHCKKMPLCT